MQNLGPGGTQNLIFQNLEGGGGGAWYDAATCMQLICVHIYTYVCICDY